VVRGHEVTVFTTDAGLESGCVPSGGAPTIRNGVRVCYFPRVPGAGIRSPALEAAVSRHAAQFDLIHVSAIWQRTGPAAARAARAAGCPWIVSPRGALGPYSWRRGRLKKTVYYWWKERATLAGAAGFHYTSEMEADECRPYRFGQPHCIVPNSIDLRLWRRDDSGAAHWRAELGLRSHEFLGLYVGRLHHKKGLDLLPAAFAGLSDTPWRLVVIGSDDDGTASRLQAVFARHGLKERVMFFPLLPPHRLPALYSAADVFLLPSRHENFGNVAVEAAACGCYVLTSDQTGVAAQLALLGAADRLPRDATRWSVSLRARVGRGALPVAVVASVREAFARDRMADLMGSFYGRILR